ncbi:MAG: insulinase family protein [Treponema sp.]
MENFILEKKEYISDIDSIVSIYVHKKTNARVLHFSNKDDNKLFNISFYTPSKNDTGVFHIIEHSVLSGSRKYRTSDPFMELYSSSLNTFMNAMTTMDITMYPFSTRNTADFYNLMDMYLDAVFFPLIYEKKEIFYKEGWHYEIKKKEDELKYTGVVYNEMKGLLADRIAKLSYFAFKTHYNNHHYSFNSGGEPLFIPNLTYDEFISTHKKHYHPSNSLTFLYGDMDIEKSLKMLDEYFSQFEKGSSQLDQEYEKDKTNKNRLVDYYSVSEDDELSLIALGYKIEDKTNLFNAFVLDILQEVLFICPYSPIRLNILENGLAKDIYSMPIKRKRSDFFILGIDVEKEDEFILTVENGLKELVNKGIDKELLDASINLLEIEFEEANYSNSHGLFYLFKLLDFWYYGIEPFEFFNISLIIKELREKAKTNFFEEFIEKHFLQSSFKSYSFLLPEKNQIEKKEIALKEKLRLYKESLSISEIDKLIKLNETLELYSNVKDKKVIPRLKLEDIDRKIWNCEYLIEKNKDFTLLHVDMFSSNIVYFNFAFEISNFNELCTISFLTDLLTQLNTKNYSYVDLNKEIALKTGGLSFFPEVIENKNTKKIDCRIILNVKVNVENYQALFYILHEIVFNTVFDDEKKIKEVLNTTILRMESESLMRGNVVARSRVASYFLLTSKYANLLGGLDYLWFLKDLKQNYKSKKEGLKLKLMELYKALFHRDNLVVSITTSSNNLALVKEKLNEFVESLPKREKLNESSINELKKLNEGIICNTDVMYVAKGYDITKLGYKYSGELLVLCNILNSGYLYNQVRVKGGAYGVNIGVLSNKSLIATSYRDPHLKTTLKAYNEMYKYLSNLSLTKEELDSAIIGSVKDFYIPIFPESEAIRALRLFLSGRTNENIMKTIDEALSTSKKSLIGYAPLLENLMKSDFLCVLGNEKKIKENKELFDNIVPLK